MQALPRRDVRVLTWLLPPVMGALALVEALSDKGFTPTAAHLIVVALWVPAGLVLARRWPAVGVVAVAAFYPVGILLDIPGPGGTGLISTLLAAGWAGYASHSRHSWWGLAATMIVYALSDTLREGFSWLNVFFPLIFVAAWWSGALVRREQARGRQLVELAAALDTQREAMAHAAVVEERTRIAREIHDAVAHSVSVMTLQIGGLRRQLNDVLETRPAERDVMLGLERLGRQSVEELRSLVGIMRSSGMSAPAGNGVGASATSSAALAPSLARADELVMDVRAAGLPVTLSVDGEPGELHRALDVSAYRVLQEALTNVLRHAPGSATSVSIRHARDAVTIEVTNDRPAVAPHNDPGVGGHGLVGMRERTTMFGGTLQAGPRDDGRFTVTARFPIPRRWP